MLKISPENAASVVAAMTLEEVYSATRLPTGDQNFVFAVTTKQSDYVIRMTDAAHKHKFIAALYWQNKLLPLGVPLAPFIKTDLEGKYSPYPSLLMHRLAGDDLCNVYATLSDGDKKNLAQEMVTIQSRTNSLPDGVTFGMADSYEQVLADKTWFDLIVNRLTLFKEVIKETAVFDVHHVEEVLLIAQSIKSNLMTVTSRPFLWDASERNVMVHQGKISGIVDVDELCFGDPLFVIALTHICLALEHHDSVYTDYWEQLLNLDAAATARLNFYKLFYVIVFMRKHAMNTANKKQVLFDTELLKTLFNEYLSGCTKT